MHPVSYTHLDVYKRQAFHSADAVVGFSCHGSTFRETKNNLLGAETWVLENTRYKK